MSPKTHRDFLRRSIAQAHRHLDEAGADLEGVRIEFEPAHPEMAKHLEAIQQTLLSTMEAIEVFCANAWGRDDPNFESWRNPGTHQKDVNKDA